MFRLRWKKQFTCCFNASWLAEHQGRRQGHTPRSRVWCLHTQTCWDLLLISCSGWRCYRTIRALSLKRWDASVEMHTNHAHLWWSCWGAVERCQYHWTVDLFNISEHTIMDTIAVENIDDVTSIWTLFSSSHRRHIYCLSFRQRDGRKASRCFI